MKKVKMKWEEIEMDAQEMVTEREDTRTKPEGAVTAVVEISSL
jgi:hypothetical protein